MYLQRSDGKILFFLSEFIFVNFIFVFSLSSLGPGCTTRSWSCGSCWENIGKALSLFCLPGPALAAPPVPDLDLAPGPAPGEWGAMHSLLEGVCKGTNVHSSTFPDFRDREAWVGWLQYSCPAGLLHSAPLKTEQNRNQVNHVWLWEAGETRVFHTLAGNYSRDAPVLTLLTSLLGLSPQKIQLQVWKGLLSPEEVPLPLLLPWGETEAEPLQVLVWRQKEKAV